ncbi:hypothetical protein OXPF_38780 [Oxobacter pfennigii]|uniref:Uncharacterized protein n=1 Tax=Oxobacter pfennigii TaxID=36849 RepID=A0A0P8W4V8_9CLOT|nr:hypothetical protein [Oxobacter pfennigii]KPU42578.1 hypothetical protein OXPF_38780 [Oxobacter pfennigii]
MTAEKEVFIILSDTGTLFTRTIKLFTRAPFNHTSIAFDSDFNEVYSFGRKNVHNPFFAGLVKENLYHPFFSMAKCAIYRCRVSKKDYNRMYHYVNKMMKVQDRYTYNLLGLVAVLLKTEINRKYSYFCSQFVAHIFEQSSIKIVDKPCCFVEPEDFAKSPYVEEIFKGMLMDFLYDDYEEQLSFQ